MTRKIRGGGTPLHFSAMTPAQPRSRRKGAGAVAGPRPAVEIIAEFVGLLGRLEQDHAGRRQAER